MKEEVVQIALEHPDKSPRELAPYIIVGKLFSLGTDCSLTMIRAISQQISRNTWRSMVSGILGGTVSSHDSGQDRTFPSVYEKRGQTPALFYAMGVIAGDRSVHGVLQQRAIP